MKKKTKERWSFKQIEVEFNVVLVKIKAIFKKEGIIEKPSSVSIYKRIKINKVVNTELQRLRFSETPSNLISDTILQIADKEKSKAIRSGRYDDALSISIIEYIVQESQKKKNLSTDRL